VTGARATATPRDRGRAGADPEQQHRRRLAADSFVGVVRPGSVSITTR